MLQIARILDDGKAVILASMTDTRHTRERLITAAMRVIEKEGESGVRIRDICKATNTVAPSVYYFFGDRLGLVRAAQASRYQTTLGVLHNQFAESAYRCKNKAEFTKLAHKFLRVIFSKNRDSFRSTRVSVLGYAQSDHLLARELADMHEHVNKISAEPFRFAQAKGWIDHDLDPQMFYSWLIGVINGRALIELNGQHQKSAEWDQIAIRSICRLLGIDEFKSTKKPRRTRATS